MTQSAANDAPKSILILKSNPMALQSAEQFLRTRGWAISTSTVLLEAVQVLFERPIDYFLICANHPQKKVKTLPKLLTQFQNLRVITYVDIANAINMSLLQEIGILYQILPPVSGPAIERMIFRIEKDLLLPKETVKHNLPRSMSSLSEEARMITQEKLNLFLSDDNDTTMPTLDEPGGFAVSGSPDPESFADYEAKMKTQAPGTFVNPTSKPVRINPPHQLPLTETPRGPAAKFRRSPPSFQKGIEKAVDDSVESADSPFAVQKLERAQNCVCLTVEAETFRGFLVAAMGKNRRFDDELINNIRAKLLEFLRSEGVNVVDNKPLEIKVRPVDFEHWALEKAEFLKKSIHDGNEVAMAFFPVDKTSPNFGKSEAIDMISFDIDDLATDVAVSFDVYIHLPANNKYILYTPKGGIFMKTQKERLKAKGVEKMHSKKDATAEIKKFHTESTLNNSIEDFESTLNNSKKKA